MRENLGKKIRAGIQTWGGCMRSVIATFVVRSPLGPPPPIFGECLESNQRKHCLEASMLTTALFSPFSITKYQIKIKYIRSQSIDTLVSC